MTIEIDKHNEEYRANDTLKDVRSVSFLFMFMHKTFDSLKNPVYRLYYIALICQMASMNMQMITRSLLLYRLSKSVLILGVMALAHALPMLFLSLFGGVIADRFHKKYVLIIGQTISGIVSLFIALSLYYGLLSPEVEGSWWILIITSLFHGSVMGLMMPSRQAIIHEIVSGEQLMNAVALNSLGMNVLRLLAPAFAGFLIDAYDFEAVYFIMSALYFAAVVFISLMPLTGSAKASLDRNPFHEIREGLYYIRHHQTILLVLLFALIAVLFSMPYMYLMPVFTDDILKVGAAGLGVLMSVSGFGAIIGSLFLASMPNRFRGLMMIFSGLILGISLTGFSFSRWWYLSIFFMALVGLGHAGRVTLTNTLLQYYVDDDYRGRVMSVYMMQFGLMSLGAFAAGFIAEAMSVQWAVGGFAILLAFLSILALVFIPQIRRLD